MNVRESRHEKNEPGLQGAQTFDGVSRLPAEVQKLFSREREVATIVYARGSATATDVQGRLSTRLSNGAVRSMLQRLVCKGILTRRRRGRHGAYVYLPALTTALVRENALVQLADEYFAGSLHRAALAMVNLLRARAGDNETRNRAA